MLFLQKKKKQIINIKKNNRMQGILKPQIQRPNMSDVYQSKDNWKTTNNDTDKYNSLYMCVNKAIKKRDFTFCGPATGPDSERTSTASECETLNLYKQEKPPSNPKMTILDWSSSSKKVITQSEVIIKSISGLNTPKGFICFEVTAFDLFTNCSKVTVLQRGLIWRKCLCQSAVNLSW